MSEKKRLGYIDIAKGYAMILVMVGHCLDFVNTYVFLWLYTFHMPFFFSLSGFTFNANRYDSFKTFFKKKFISLMVPYYALASLLAISMLIYGLITTGNLDVSLFLKRELYILIANRNHPQYFTMWFLPALFFSELLFYWIDKACKNKVAYLSITFVLLAIIGSVITKFIQGFYYSLYMVPIATSFLIFGKLIKMLIEKIDKVIENKNLNKKVIYIILMLLTFAFNILFAKLNFNVLGRSISLFNSRIGNPLLFYIGAIFGTLAAIFGCIIIEKCKPLEYIGKNTLVYYAFQNTLVIPIFVKLMYKIIEVAPFMKAWPLSLGITMILSALVLAIMSEIVNRYLPFALGRKYKKS